MEVIFMNEPLISVIIPSYNRAFILTDAINSVLQQTYKNIELLFVDDCSTDILVKHYQFRSPKQMQARLDLRNSLSNKKDGICFRHVKETNYKELLADKNTCLPNYKFMRGGTKVYQSAILCSSR